MNKVTLKDLAEHKMKSLRHRLLIIIIVVNVIVIFSIIWRGLK